MTNVNTMELVLLLYSKLHKISFMGVPTALASMQTAKSYRLDPKNDVFNIILVCSVLSAYYTIILNLTNRENVR